MRPRLPSALRRRTADPSERRGNEVPAPAVTAMFDEIASVYDRMNTLMTFGQDRRWRRVAAQATQLHPGQAAIDVACGTGMLAAELAELVGPFGRIEAIDLSGEMIGLATARHRSLVQLRFQVGDALALPFPDDTFDAATIAFGLRNLSDFEAGFREMGRVVRPGGRIVCLELSLPRWRPYRTVFHAVFRLAAPLMAWAVARRRDAYRYLPASLDGFPSAESLAATMRSAGLVDVRFRRLSTGVVAVHRGVVAERS